MRRRRALRLCSSPLLIAGCLAPGRDQSATSEPSTTPAGTTRDPSTATSPTTTAPPDDLAVGEAAPLVGGGTLTVASPTVHGSIVADIGGLYRTVVEHSEYQLLVVSVRGAGDPSPGDFAVRRDGRVEEWPTPGWRVVPVTRTCAGACLALPVAPRAADEAAVVYRPDGRTVAAWRLPTDTARRFGVRSRCVLADARLVDRDGAVGVRFTVENDGARDGGFRALVTPSWVSDTSTPVGFTVPRGETVTTTVVPTVLAELSPDEATFTHVVDADTRQFEVGRE